MIWIPIVIATLALMRCFALERRLARIHKGLVRVRNEVRELR